PGRQQPGHHAGAGGLLQVAPADPHLCSGPGARSAASGRAFRHVSPRDVSPPRVHRALFVLGPVVWTRARPDAQPAFLEDPRRVEISLGPLAKIAARWSLAKDVTAGKAVVPLYPGKSQKMKVISHPPALQPLRQRRARWIGGRGWRRAASTQVRPGR